MLRKITHAPQKGFTFGSEKCFFFFARVFPRADLAGGQQALAPLIPTLKFSVYVYYSFIAQKLLKMDFCTHFLGKIPVPLTRGELPSMLLFVVTHHPSRKATRRGWQVPPISLFGPLHSNAVTDTGYVNSQS